MTYHKVVMFLILILLTSCKMSQYYKTSVNEIIFPMSINGKWFLADTLGNQIGDNEFEELRLFKYGLAVAKVNGKYGYVNLD